MIERLVDTELSRIHISDGLFQILRNQLYTLWLDRENEVKTIKKTKRKEIVKKESEISTIIQN
jgi:hypothetical protein